MPKKFLTARDIDYHADLGVREIHVDDNLIITDIGRERARERGVTLTRLPKGVPAPEHPACDQSPPGSAHAEIRAAVIARLGATPEGLDAIISRLLNGKG
ncbi:MAG: hypothetical protein AB1453_11160 [Chloroflexota bacterium]|jgi:hypothetical protein